jgi:hypothetical protein
MDEHDRTAASIQIGVVGYIRMHCPVFPGKFPRAKQDLSQFGNGRSAHVRGYSCFILNLSTDYQTKRLNHILASWTHAQPVIAFFDPIPLEAGK